MKYQVLFYQKNNAKISKTVVCCSVVIGALRVEVLVIKDLFYVMDKALSGKLSCMWIGLV